MIWVFRIVLGGILIYAGYSQYYPCWDYAWPYQCEAQLSGQSDGHCQDVTDPNDVDCIN